MLSKQDKMVIMVFSVEKKMWIYTNNTWIPKEKIGLSFSLTISLVDYAVWGIMHLLHELVYDWQMCDTLYW